MFPALIAGLADDLAANTDCVWRPHGVYQEDEVGIAVGDLPAEPHRAVALRVYGFVSDGQGDETVRVQVRVRGFPHDLASCETIADRIRDRLSFLERVTIGGYAVSGIFHDSGPLPLGADENWRYQVSENYQINLVRDILPTVDR
ncbi:minor capsid protein [Glycomyces sp. A-F 0318]|uniref:minor capsid protein n=1 Tax=Glycomyces amatae TaxID=2881355 RepID=UPI001E394CB6|nr:minor capsid protein [Glycomyces amatae]MCD0446460.1 minor capsid protein [Glycomyces amatae]